MVNSFYGKQHLASVLGILCTCVCVCVSVCVCACVFCGSPVDPSRFQVCFLVTFYIFIKVEITGITQT